MPHLSTGPPGVARGLVAKVPPRSIPSRDILPHLHQFLTERSSNTNICPLGCGLLEAASLRRRPARSGCVSRITPTALRIPDGDSIAGGEAVLSAILLFVLAGQGQAASIASGTHVFPRHADVSFYDEAHTVGTVQPGMMLEVINVNGPWLWVGRGWVAEADVIPMNKALAFYGQQIDAGPAYFPLACRSRVLYESRQYDRAIADCDEALRLDPAGTAALAMRARALARVGAIKKG